VSQAEPDPTAVALIRGAFDLYAAGDFDAMFELAHPDAVLAPVFLPDEYRGLPAVRALFEQNGDPRRRWEPSDLEFREVMGMVVVTGRLRSPGALGGRLNLPIAFLFVVRDNEIVRMEGHMTLRQALTSADTHHVRS
jgi:ketosteroid isomerase-like protein